MRGDRDDDDDGLRFVTVNEAAQANGVSPSTIWSWIARGHLRAFRGGGKTAVELGEVRDAELATRLRDRTGRASKQARYAPVDWGGDTPV